MSLSIDKIELILLTMKDKQHIMTKEALGHQLVAIILLEQMVH
jgi:hypothetical protein